MIDPSDEQHFQPPIGLCVGKFRLVKLLGLGAFSIAYLATPLLPDGVSAVVPSHVIDKTREYLVVVKLLRGELGHDQNVFNDERENLWKASKTRPEARVVRLVKGWVETTSLQGCYCLATTPYCSGVSLQDLIRTRPGSYDLPMAMRWAAEVAETLHLLHAMDGDHLYHGDVAPRNSFLRPARDGSGRL